MHHAYAASRLAIVIILAGTAASCGEAPDKATRCANAVADMFDVRRVNVALVDPADMPEGDSGVVGAVDTWQSPENTRFFSCTFDAQGEMTVEILHSDAE